MNAAVQDVRGALDGGRVHRRRAPDSRLRAHRLPERRPGRPLRLGALADPLAARALHSPPGTRLQRQLLIPLLSILKKLYFL